MEFAIDSIDFKITVRGDYLGSKWNRKRRGCTKFHAVISTNDLSVFSFATTDEHVNDTREERKILKNLLSRVKRIFSDKGYDSKSI